MRSNARDLLAPVYGRVTEGFDTADSKEAKALIDAVSVFDVYRGPELGKGKKSLAIAVTLQPTKRTLTDAEIEAAAAKIVAAVAKATGGTLRG